MDTSIPPPVLCVQCDALYRRPLLHEDEEANCPRCGAALLSSTTPSFTRSIWLLVASMALYLLAAWLPMISVTSHGLRRDVTVWKAMTALWRETWGVVPLFVTAFSFLLPLIQAGLTAWVFAFAWLHKPAPGRLAIRRWMQWLRPWLMMDVMLAAMVLAAVRLTSEALVDLRASIWLLVLACMGFGASSRHSIDGMAPRAHVRVSVPGRRP